MKGYWFRHRALLSLLLSVSVALISCLLFVCPFVSQSADNYNSQSIYKNTSIEFIAPDPSFEQVSNLPGSNGIDKIFPFFYTKISVNVNGKSRPTSILLCDTFENIDITMYNNKRLIKKSDSEFENPILVDWQFCKDSAADIGDKVSFSIGGADIEYTIYAIYETNSIYENGAILVQINADQKDVIVNNSQINGYSGIYISTNDYNACQTYLTKDYRPLGRLRGREHFDSEEQYQIHYDAITSSGYANEITDFRVKENNLDKKICPLMIYIGSALSVVIIIVFNAVMSRRGCEKGYFTKHCLVKGINVKPYYSVSFIFEVLFFSLIYTAALLYKVRFSTKFISESVLGAEIIVIPVTVLIAEIICLIMNNRMIIETKTNTEDKNDK